MSTSGFENNSKSCIVMAVIVVCCPGASEWQVYGTQDNCVVRGTETTPGFSPSQQDFCWPRSATTVQSLLLQCECVCVCGLCVCVRQPFDVLVGVLVLK